MDYFLTLSAILLSFSLSRQFHKPRYRSIAARRDSVMDKQRFSPFCEVCVQSASRMKRYFGIKANKTLSIYREKAADYDDVFVFFLNLAIRSLSGFENRPFSLDD